MISLFTVFQPSPGLALWTVIIFLAFWWLVAKFAFKPIVKALESRQDEIQTALDTAKLAREEVRNMKAENEKLLAEAQIERSKMLQEAKDMKAQIINEARDKAKEEANKIIANAKIEIDNQTKASITEAKNHIGLMAIQIAEKVINKELKGQPEHESFVKDLVKDLNLN
ncbi:MAG TPA: F0F1 ATP synthase subunit B [Saprospiraceae bacterium]|nr:F0F1 ATP synthase subunit B [Saprospiraceae bacterium]